jgi:hypothetical protein
MYKNANLLGLTIASLWLVAGSVVSQDAGPYTGVGLSFANGTSTAQTGTGASDGNVTGLSVVLGNKWDRGGLSYAVELGADVALDSSVSPVAPSGDCGDDADGAYMCSQDATVRLRGLIGTQLGEAEVFGAMGIGAAFGDFATDTSSVGSGSVYGLTFGTGVTYPVNDSLSIRGEVNYDYFTGPDQRDGTDSEWDALSARVMAIFNF